MERCNVLGKASTAPPPPWVSSRGGGSKREEDILAYFTTNDEPRPPPPFFLGGNLGWRRIEGFSRSDKTAKVVRVGMIARRRAWWRGVPGVRGR